MTRYPYGWTPQRHEARRTFETRMFWATLGLLALGSLTCFLLG